MTRSFCLLPFLWRLCYNDAACNGWKGDFFMLSNQILSFIYSLVILLIAIDVHEFSHAWVANRLGDPTARYMGRLSLNPIVHLDPYGTLFMLIATFSGFGLGWGKPVPVNPLNLRGNMRRSMGLVSVAGAVSNITVAIIAAILFRLGSMFDLPNQLLVFFGLATYINIGLAVFNLIPMPPLDGSKVAVGILSLFRGRWAYDLSERFQALESMNFMPLILLLFVLVYFAGPVLGRIIEALASPLLGI
jgi:Zn-dependent protease